MIRRSLLPVAIAAAVVALLGAVPAIADALSLKLVVGWSWAETQRTPSRSLPLPVAYWAAIALYAWWIARRRPIGAAATFALLFLCAGAVAVSGPLVTLRSDPLLASLPAAYGIYAKLVTLALLAGLGALAAHAVRVREELLYPTAGAAVIAAARLLSPLDPLGLAALAGGATAVLAFRGRLPAIRPPSRWELVTLVAILVVAVGARMLLVTSFSNAHGLDFAATSDDGPSYDDISWMFATGRAGEVPKDHYFYNAYILFLSPLFAIAGHSFLFVGFVQALLGAVTAWATYWLARRLAGPPVALVAAAVVAIDGLLIEMSASIGTEAVAVPFLVVTLVLLVRGQELSSTRSRLLLVAAAGALLGLSAATRDVMVGLPVFLAPWVAWATWRRKRSVPAAAVATALLFACVIAVWLPFSIYRQRFALTTEYTAPVAYSLGHEELERLGISVRAGIGPSLAVVAARPGDVAGAFAHEMWSKWDRLFFSTSYGTFDPTYLVQSSLYARTLEVYFLVALGAGVVLLARRRTAALETRVLLLSLPLYAIAAHVVLFHANAAGRYRSPYDIVFAVAFAFAAVQGGALVWRRLAPSA